MMKITIQRQAYAAILTLLLASCGGGGDSVSDRERAMEDAAAHHGIDVDVSVTDAGEPDKIVIEAAGGQVGSGLSLPAGFPVDISVPSEWNIMAASAPMPGSFTVQALSNDRAEAILTGLRDQMSENGWIESDFAQMTPQMARLSFEKDTQMATFTITENGETRLVQVLSMPKP